MIRKRAGQYMVKFSNLFQKAKPNISEKPIQSDSQETSWSALSEGELLIDMYEKPDALVIRSLVAGTRPEDIEISLHNDILTIRGKREELEEIYENQFLYRECYWGEFSRTIILPSHVAQSRIEAFFKNGVMFIILPKLQEQESIRPELAQEGQEEE